MNCTSRGCPETWGSTRDGWNASTRHFARYVDDGRLPGWLAVVTRRGTVAHVGSAGHRDLEAGLPVTVDTLFRIYSMTKPITSVAAMMLYEEGAFELKDPVHRFIAGVPRPAGVPRRVTPGTRDRAGDRTGPHVASPHPHGRAHLWLPLRPSRRRHVPGRRVRLGAARPRRDLAACCERVGFAAPVVRAGDGMELLGGDRRAGTGRRGASRARRSTSSSRTADLRATGDDRHGILVAAEGGRHRLADALRSRSATGRVHRLESMAEDGAAPADVAVGRRGAGLERCGLSPVHPDAAARRGARRRAPARRPGRSTT